MILAHFASCSGIQASKRLNCPPPGGRILRIPGHTHPLYHRYPYTSLSCSQKLIETQKQKVRYQLEQLYQFLKQQEQLFVAWLEDLGQTIGQVWETYDNQVSRDIALLNEPIEELEAKQCQSEWELIQVSVAGPGLAWLLCPAE